VLGFWSQLPGFAHNVTPNSVTVAKGWTNIYNLAFLVGFAISFTSFYTFSYLWPPSGLGEVDEYDVYHTFTPEEAARLGVTPDEGTTIVEGMDESVEAVSEKETALEKGYNS
jgi:NCS1 family nucleobase:cation symporter-1